MAGASPTRHSVGWTEEMRCGRAITFSGSCPDTLMLSGAICGRYGQKWRHILETSR